MKKILFVLFVLLGMSIVPVAAQSSCVEGVCLDDMRARALMSLMQVDKLSVISLAYAIVGAVIGVICLPMVPNYRRNTLVATLVLIGVILATIIIGWLFTIAMMIGLLALIVATILFAAGGSFLLLLLRRT